MDIGETLESCFSCLVDDLAFRDNILYVFLFCDAQHSVLPIKPWYEICQEPSGAVNNGAAALLKQTAVFWKPGTSASYPCRSEQG